MANRKFKLNTTVISLILKEFKSLLFSTTGLIAGILFVVVTGILVFGLGRFAQFGTNDLSQVFGYVVFALSITIPALVMSSISKERGSGTIEYLMAKPISELQLLIAKFIAYSALSTLLILLTIPFTLLVTNQAGIDFGQVFMQYIGAIVLAIVLVSIGISVSSVFKSEIASFLVSIVVIGLFLIIGSSFMAFLPASAATFLSNLSLLTHYQSISRGVLDLRDLFYFIGFLLSALTIAYYFLIKDKYPANHKALRNSKILTVLIIVIAILIGALGQVIPGRVDFTSDQRYTLSDISVQTLNKIDGNLEIDYYTSPNLPLEFQTELKRVGDLLLDYQKFSNGKLNLNQKSVVSDEDKTQAETAGIQQIRFSVNSQDSAQVVTGYFGMSIRYKDQTETLNFNNEILNDLEYQVTKKLIKLTEVNKKKIAFVANNVAYSISSDLTRLNADLTDIYNIQQIDLTSETSTIPVDIQVLAIVGPISAFEQSVVDSIKNFYSNGGSILFLTDTVDTNQQTPTINTNSLGNLFENYGIKVNNDLVYDLEKNNVIAIQSLFSPVVFNFPQWIIAQPQNTTTSITKDISNVSLLWANTISIEQKEGVKVFELLKTSSNANVQTEGKFNTSFEQEWIESDSDSTRTVAVALENPRGGRAVVVSDTDFITDSILDALSQRESQDKDVISFVLNSISWLSRDNLIGSIKAKGSTAKLLNLTSEQQIPFISLSLGVPIVIVLLNFGVYNFNRRRLMKKEYKLV